MIIPYHEELQSAVATANGFATWTAFCESFITGNSDLEQLFSTVAVQLRIKSIFTELSEEESIILMELLADGKSETLDRLSRPE